MDDADLLNIFWDEANEYLETLNGTLLQVEMLSAKDDPEAYHGTVKEMNRVAHSLKGAARAVGISVIETVAHYMEEVFGAAMEGKLTLAPEVADMLYDGLDLIQTLSDGREISEDVLALALKNLEGVVASAASPDVTQEAAPVPPTTQTQTGEHPVDASSNGPPPDSLPTRELPAVNPLTAPPMPRQQGVPPPPENQTVVIRQAEESIRVTVSKLDRLMAEVTELFVARMHSEEQIQAVADLQRLHNRWQREWRGVRTSYIRLVRRLQDQHDELGAEMPALFRFLEFNQRSLSEANRLLSSLAHNVAQDTLRLSTLADQLQDEIGGLRLVPFEAVIGGFQRMVRDTARDIGKEVTLEIEGAAVEIDKAVLDSLREPLMHLLRNAVDHGIEAPNVRAAAGKPSVGRVRIVVDQRGSEIVIYVSDDGGGIDADAVRRSAVSKGLISEMDAANQSDEEIRTYIFYSGFSTANSVTRLSGRGMGMDIVRDRVESLRGRVSVESVIGSGTTITLNVPVSLTRIRCVLLRVGDQRFGVPSAMVMRMDTFSRKHVFTAEGRDVLLINQRPMPLVSMASVLEVPSSGAAEEDEIRVVALRATDRTVAFEVDGLESEIELVLKPLGPELARTHFVSGAALLGTGEIIIILDANDLVRRATGTFLPQRRAAITAPMPTVRRLRVLVVDDSITTRTLEKNILETAGFDVFTAMDGTEAWSMLPQYDFDAIISDVEMPNMNGLELCAQVKSSGRFQHIPVVLLTSLSKPEQREAGLRVGADAYLVKSQFDQGELLATIQSVVG